MISRMSNSDMGCLFLQMNFWNMQFYQTNVIYTNFGNNLEEITTFRPHVQFWSKAN